MHRSLKGSERSFFLLYRVDDEDNSIRILDSDFFTHVNSTVINTMVEFGERKKLQLKIFKPVIEVEQNRTRVSHMCLSVLNSTPLYVMFPNTGL